ncbi:MAG: ACP S-malonyltransferase [Chitinophagales bacterium]
MKAFIFSGQGSQIVGMGKTLCNLSDTSMEYLEIADDILGYKLSDLMFEGTKQQLKETKITQPAVFVYSVIKARITRDFKPEMVAGHSLGEFSALSAVRAIKYADALRLVAKRGELMQAACEANPSTMAAVLGLDDAIIESICASIEEEVVVPANYNYPGQLVISGSLKGIEIASEKLKEAGARNVLKLRVGGAFHSPLMESAKEELAKAIEATTFREPPCPVYQNVTGTATQDPEELKANLIEHLTSPVRWTTIIENMAEEGARTFIEVGPRPILTNMVKKINDRISAEVL